MELLVLKADRDYFRFRSSDFSLGTLAQASVYPLDQADVVIALQEQLRGAGYPQTQIRQLSISEEQWEGNRG
jgi:hypothetical protein